MYNRLYYNYYWSCANVLLGSALDLDSLDGDRNSSEQPSHNGSQIGQST